MTTDSPSVQPSGKALSAAERMRAYRRRRRRGLGYVRSHARGRRLERPGRQAGARAVTHAVSQLDFFAVVKVEGVQQRIHRSGNTLRVI
jgi:hypothetical protein